MKTDSPRGPGRPAYLAPEERRRSRVVVPTNNAEHARYQALAEHEGVPLSELIRRELDRLARKRGI